MRVLFLISFLLSMPLRATLDCKGAHELVARDVDHERRTKLSDQETKLHEDAQYWRAGRYPILEWERASLVLEIERSLATDRAQDLANTLRPLFEKYHKAHFEIQKNERLVAAAKETLPEVEKEIKNLKASIQKAKSEKQSPADLTKALNENEDIATYLRRMIKVRDARTEAKRIELATVQNRFSAASSYLEFIAKSKGDGTEKKAKEVLDELTPRVNVETVLVAPENIGGTLETSSAAIVPLPHQVPVVAPPEKRRNFKGSPKDIAKKVANLLQPRYVSRTLMAPEDHFEPTEDALKKQKAKEAREAKKGGVGTKEAEPPKPSEPEYEIPTLRDTHKQIEKSDKARLTEAKIEKRKEFWRAILAYTPSQLAFSGLETLVAQSKLKFLDNPSVKQMMNFLLLERDRRLYVGDIAKILMARGSTSAQLELIKRANSSSDDRFLLTFARGIESKDTWEQLQEVARNSADQEFYKKMEKAENDAKELGTFSLIRSSTHENLVHLITSSLTAVAIGGGSSYATYKVGQAVLGQATGDDKTDDPTANDLDMPDKPKEHPDAIAFDQLQYFLQNDPKGKEILRKIKTPNTNIPPEPDPATLNP